MLDRLRKLAGASQALRTAALEKTALGLLGRAVVGAVKKDPLGAAATAAGVGLTAAAAPGAMRGSYQKSMAGFDPGVQRMLSGTPPVPPGTT